MDTIFMGSENSKRLNLMFLILNLTDQINLRRDEKRLQMDKIKLTKSI